MSRRHWREVQRVLRNQGVAWSMEKLVGTDLRKHRNAWRRNGKTAAQWFPPGVPPKRVMRMEEWWL